MPVQKRDRASLMLESALWAQGFRAIAGVDEVGRGAWAGPVVAAAVVLPADTALLSPLLGVVDDSKRLTPASRRRLDARIRELALGVGVGSVPAHEVDRLGIVPATRRAMSVALASLEFGPDFVLLDYLTLPELEFPQRGIAHGDAISLTIAAASIVAKVARDRWMVEQDALLPGYGFADHKGYGTAQHSRALSRLGPSDLHRLTFQPVSQAAASPAGTAPSCEDGDARAGF